MPSSRRACTCAGTDQDSRRFAPRPTDDVDAYELYLRAIHRVEHATEEDYLAARELLGKALERDPSFALAYAALATTYAVMAVDGFARPRDAWPESSRNVQHALDRDADLPDAHAAAASIAFFFEWDWARADREWTLALGARGGDLDPTFLMACALQQWAVGRLGAARDLVHRARLMDPLSPAFVVKEADFLVQAERLDEAGGLYAKAIRDAPDDPRAYFGLAEARDRQGRFDDAIDARRRAHLLAGTARCGTSSRRRGGPTATVRSSGQRRVCTSTRSTPGPLAAATCRRSITPAPTPCSVTRAGPCAASRRLSKTARPAWCSCGSTAPGMPCGTTRRSVRRCVASGCLDRFRGQRCYDLHTDTTGGGSMRLRPVAAMLLTLTAGCAGAELLACGDKFLVVSRGTRFERAPLARQNVGILLYANPTSDLRKAITSLSVEAALRKAGYRPFSVSNIDDLDKALRAGGWELVVVNLADAPAASTRVGGPDAPLVLPVALNPPRAVLAAAKKRSLRRHQCPDQGPDVPGCDRRRDGPENEGRFEAPGR